MMFTVDLYGNRGLDSRSVYIVQLEELPPPESFYIGTSSPDGGSKIRRIKEAIH